MVDTEDTLELILQRLEADGHDMTQMREARAAIHGLPVGDDTPPAGTLKVQEFVAPVHQWWNDPQSERVWLPPFSTQMGPPRHWRRLTRRVNRLYTWVLGLTMTCASCFVVIGWKW